MLDDKIVNKEFKVSDATLDIEREINKSISELIQLLSLYRPEVILKKFSEEEIGRLFSNKILGIWDSNELNRYTEYIQSLLVSTSIEFKNSKLEEDDFENLKNHLDRIFKLTDNYWFTFKIIDSHTEIEKDSNLSLDIIEAQFMYRVRGDRYPVLDKEYFQLLLEPHEDIFKEIFQLSIESIISGFEALKKSLYDNFNRIPIEILKEWKRFNELSEKKQKEYFEKKNQMRNLFVLVSY